ncbi:MAG: fatty acid desaturase [Burkholderiaceae bacterium]|jgi:stearoyl-CoA desaturase (delta-9 desaturase)|nr:fatty acid desaturase [Burkholderiaceae bacterium]HMQ71130.1 fatty acid desaturase [Rubrivivax sp.]
MNELRTLHDVVVQWLAHGLLDASWWQIVLFTLVTTHITIVAVTVFLHRAQAHRALELGPVPSHFFRFWLWLSTGMVTKEWVAIHRKHHARCETADDPHSPVAHGLRTVLLRGSELYRAEAKVDETLRKYGHHTPDDWLERRVYSRYSWQGVGLLLILDLLLFGAIGATVWAVQMAWIPVTAAGIINGLGHAWGYRNFESPDASTNLSPIGLIIGGEELHNNHHTYPTSAKLSVKRYEFDIGWGYIRLLEMIGWARVRKTPPRLALGEVRPAADARTLQVLIAHRYEVMARFGNALRRAVRAEIAHLKRQGADSRARLASLALARRWLHRDADKVPGALQPRLQEAIGASPQLAKLVAMREELRQLWTRTNVSADQLVADLQAWCRRAEESGIAALQEFSRTLRAARA